jgi:two-component system phosphate regulon sensor histidine kinase PhoR
MRPRSWKYHLGRLIAGLLLAIVLGLVSGYPVLLPGILLAAWFAWQTYNSIRLYRWLHSWDEDPPESLGMWSDIFDRIMALQKQNSKRQKQYQTVIDDFQGMADAFPDATLAIDSSDMITWFNDSAIQLLGLQDPADRGQAVTNLIREPGFADWLAVQDRVESKLEIPCPTDDNITLQITLARFRENQRLLILRDVTDVENLDRIRRDFIANVSHELRTPLTVLIGYLEVMQSQQDIPDPRAVDRMYRQARQMHDMLEDLLELSRLQDTEISNSDTDIDVPALLAQLGEQAEEYSKGEHKLRFRIQQGLNLSGVEADISSAFQNLLTNAINYTPAGGKITTSWKETDDGLVLSVKDSGVGIPHRDIPRLTERFYRVGSDRARHTGGTGLGLAIVKHVLNTHQARLEISSELGKGSEFSCVFPLNRKA